MNAKKQQMRLQLQHTTQRRHNRTGFETLLDQSAEAERRDASPPLSPLSQPVLSLSGGASWWSPQTDYRPNNRYYDSVGGGGSDAATATDDVRTSPSSVTTPTTPLSLPSPYYDRNPAVAFPFRRHHVAAANAVARSPPGAEPLSNVQNVARAADQEHHQQHTNKFFYPKHQCDNNYGPDDDKENIKHEDPESLQQQLDEVLRACADYEERHRGRQQVPSAESPGNVSSGSAASTPPQQNRIKTNGSLPRDANRPPGTGTSSPTTPHLSPTSPSPSTWPSTASASAPAAASPVSLAPSPAAASPVSLVPSPAAASPVSPAAASTVSLAALSPLSLSMNKAAGDPASSDNGGRSGLPTSATSPMATGCGSPRTRIRTLVPYCPSPAFAADQQCNGNNTDRRLQTFAAESDGVLPPRSPDPVQRQRRQQQQQPHQQQQLSPVPASTLLPWQPTTSWLSRSSPVTDFTDGGGGATTAAQVLLDRTTAATEQRRKLLVELSAHKSRLVEMHLRREEVDRELIIETALLHAELDAADNETRQSENIVDGLDRAVTECRQQMDICTVKQQEQRVAADSLLAEHRRELQELRNRLESIDDDDGLKNEIRESIDKQTELLEAEQKLYEDVEFGLLEEEAGWLARREELHRDRAAAVAVRRARRARAEWLRAQLDQLRSVGDDQLRALRHDINAATLSIQQGHKKLQELDAQDHHRCHSRRPQSPPGRASPVIADHPPPQQPPRSPHDWPWNNNNNGYRSPVTKSPAPPLSPWLAADADRCASNAMTGSMTTTCCSSTGSGSGAEDNDGCRPISEDSMSRMSMSTIFDGSAGIKMRQKNKSSLADMTKRPLTRYLPVRCDGDGTIAFDLRAHIESAGHQLDGDGSADDKRFWIDSTSCRGYLKKLSGATAGGKRGRKWLKRWFVFDRRSRTLAYYRRNTDHRDATATAVTDGAAKKAGRARATVRFQDIQEVYVDHTNSSQGQGCAFVVKTVQRTFYLSAATGQAVRVWVDVIFTGAEGYREYLTNGSAAGDGTIVGIAEAARGQQPKS